MAEKIKLTDLEKDALKETANIGAGNASTSLSKIVKARVDLVVSDLDIIELSNVEKAISGPKEIVVGLYSSATGSMDGGVMVVLPRESALTLSSMMKGKKGCPNDILSKKDQQLLKKVGKILTNSYVKSLKKFLKIKVNELKVVSTFGQSISDIIMLTIKQNIKFGLIIKTDFTVEKTKITGKFILLLTSPTIRSFLNKLKLKEGI